jgi:6-phospho-3-hexuloisomerase
MSNVMETLNTITAEIRHALSAIDDQALAEFCTQIVQAPHVFVAGKGRSGLQMRGFAMRLMHLGRPVHVVDDVTTPAISNGDLLIIGSGSGNTKSLVNYAAKANREGAGVGLITISKHSAIREMADHVIYIDAPTPKAADSTATTSIMPMGSLFEVSMGVLLEIVIIRLMDKTGMTAESMFEQHANLE